MDNIPNDLLEEMHHNRTMTPMSREIAQGVSACRDNCEYFSVCGGGAPINKLAENGSFTGTRTSFCSLTQMVPVDLILDAFDRLSDGAIPEARGHSVGSVESRRLSL